MRNPPPPALRAPAPADPLAALMRRAASQTGSPPVRAWLLALLRDGVAASGTAAGKVVRP